jgi:nitroreductase
MGRHPAGRVVIDDDQEGQAMSTGTETTALAAAAEAALRAPSIFNTQPWRWHIAAGVLELSADPDRQLPVVDPDHRLSTLSCGIALHHARVALAAEGRTVEVRRLPDPARPDLLARIRITGHHRPQTADIHRYQSILIRHTDRRLFTDRPVPGAALDRLRVAAESEDAHLHPLRAEDVPELASAVSHAQNLETADPAYRAELSRWTTRPAGSGDGVPADTTTPPAPRTVPVREFDLDRAPGGEGLPAGTGHDESATYTVLAGDADNPDAWLRAGQALSAVLLQAAHEGLAVSPMSDVAELPATRTLLRRLLAGIGHPYLVLRIGVADPATGVPPTPRRDPDDAITTDN